MLSLLALLAAPATALAEKAATTPIGHWKTFDLETKRPDSIVTIWESNGELKGRIAKLINPPEKSPVCGKCPGDKRNQPMVGLEFLWGFKREAGGFSEGQILDPRDGKTYNASLEVIDAGKRLKVFGYTRVLVKIGETEFWERTNAPE